MVQIRRLRPTITIALPTVEKRDRPSQRKVVERRIADFPPPTPQPTPCRLWQGSVDPDGYGRMKRNGKTVRVYRWVMEEALGRKLQPHEFILHACDNPPCFRLDHLSVGSARDNNLDMLFKGRAVPPPVNRFLGSLHPMAKFSDYQIRKIRHDYETGVRDRTLAAEYSVDVRTIRKIVKGLTYADTSTPDLLARWRDADASDGAGGRGSPSSGR